MCNIQRLSTRRSNNTEGKQGVAFSSCGREANSSCSDVRARRQETAMIVRGLPIKKSNLPVTWLKDDPAILDPDILGLGEGDAAAKAR